MPSVRSGEVYRHNLHEYWSTEIHEASEFSASWCDNMDLLVESGVFILSKLKMVNDHAEQTIEYTNGLVVN